jgi:hypothetical protein
LRRGAGVIDLSTTPMPPAVADHVAAVALFGEPSSGLSSTLRGGEPLPTISPLYGPKTISSCAPDDSICSGDGNIMAHVSYLQSGMTSQAATFAANRLNQGPDRVYRHVPARLVATHRLGPGPEAQGPYATVARRMRRTQISDATGRLRVLLN